MQNVSTPRIYVNLHLWAKAMGLIDEYISGSQTVEDLPTFQEIFESGGNPAKTKIIYGLDSTHTAMNIQAKYKSKIIPQIMEGNCYLAFLGHNLASEGERLSQEIHFYLDASTDGVNYDGSFVGTGGINAEVSWQSNIFKASYDGFSIVHFNYSGEAHNEIFPTFVQDTSNGTMTGGEEIKMGGIAFGNYYDFPHSPDLSLTIGIDMEGITTQETKGGATLSNLKYSGTPKWGELGAWELGDSDAAKLGARAGRRTWNLTFSYLTDKQTLPINALGTTFFNSDSASLYTEGTDYTISDPDYFNSNVLNGEDFFSAVWNKTLGGHLPFIFNPQGGGDSPNNNPDQFAICRFDQDSLQVKQVAYNTYTIKVKIIETW